MKGKTKYRIGIVIILLTLLISTISADQTFILCKSQSAYHEQSWSYSTGSQTSYLPCIQFAHIENFGDIDYLKWVVSETYVNHDTLDLQGAQTNFSSAAGDGFISWSHLGSDYHVYFYFNSFSNLGLTGNQKIPIYYDEDSLDNFYVTQRSTAWFDDDFDCFIGSIYGLSPLSGVYTVYYGKLWKNIVDCEDLQGEATHITVDRTTHSSSSTVWVESALNLYYQENSGSGDVDTMSFELPIYIKVQDIWGYWYNITYEGDLGEKNLHGFVKDIKNESVINLANITLYAQYNNTYIDSAVSNEIGYYSLYELDIGDYTLFTNKTGYENDTYNFTIDNSNELYIYDIYLIPIKTNPLHSTSVYGRVRDYTTKNPLNNTLITIFNDTYNTYTYTNNLGYYEKTGLYNTSYVVEVSRTGYNKNVTNINLPYINVSYNYNFELISITDETITTEGEEEEEITSYDRLISVFESVGLSSGLIGLIFGMVVIAFFVCLFSYASHGKEYPTAIGGIIGFILSCFMGFFPIYLLYILIFICAIMAAKMYASKGG